MKLENLLDIMDAKAKKEHNYIWESMENDPLLDIDVLRYFQEMKVYVAQLTDRNTAQDYTRALEGLEDIRNRWRYANNSETTRFEYYYRLQSCRKVLMNGLKDAKKVVDMVTGELDGEFDIATESLG